MPVRKSKPTFALGTQALSATPFHLDVQAVPEAATPGSFGLLLLLGTGGLLTVRRRKAIPHL